jgi:hypothetical protein
MSVLGRATAKLDDHRKSVVAAAKDKAVEIVDVGLTECLESFAWADGESIRAASDRLLMALVAKLQE